MKNVKAANLGVVDSMVDGKINVVGYGRDVWRVPYVNTDVRNCNYGKLYVLIDGFCYYLTYYTPKFGWYCINEKNPRADSYVPVKAVLSKCY